LGPRMTHKPVKRSENRKVWVSRRRVGDVAEQAVNKQCQIGRPPLGIQMPNDGCSMDEISIVIVVIAIDDGLKDGERVVLCTLASFSPSLPILTCTNCCQNLPRHHAPNLEY
jgi:hypothetical protein